ncbi:MAG: hypothetical protein JXQ90_11120 [Cyclobacteriaceae bacterium]
MKSFIPILLTLATLSSMAQGVGDVLSTNYHNVTAHYNGYFIARERVLEVENGIQDRFQWNYNEILPVFALYDTTVSKSFETQLQDGIEKASIAIQRHPGSRWEDDAYIQVGKARLYGSEFPEAIETFKYVNTHGDNKNDRHVALVYLLRTFVESREFKNALAVSEYVQKEKLSEKNEQLFRTTLAFYYQAREDYESMAKHLSIAEKLMPKGREKARIAFILGQIYQHLGQDDLAYNNYKTALKNSKTYELTFFTKLNMAQVSQLNTGGDEKKIKKYFRKLLKDPKNIDYHDKIYYEMGEFELKRGQLAKAIEFYKNATAAGKGNNRQKSYSYLRLGMIYYDSLKDFSLAKTYYDSASSILPKDSKEYLAIQKRHEVLDDFVNYYTTLITNDSILAVTKMSSSTLDSLVEIKLDEKEAQFLTAKELRKKEKRRSMFTESAGETFYTEENQSMISQDLSGQWYFYNITLASNGPIEFRQKWGDRPLQDNWRRTQNIAGGNNNINETDELSGLVEKDDELAESFNRENEKQQILNGLPTEQGELNALLQGIEESLYHLGNIYNFRLEEKDNAISSFTALINRFDTSQYRPEVLYQLFLLHKETDTAKSVIAANEILNRFEETIYAKLIFNPNYREESKVLSEKLRKIYHRAYFMYTDGNYQASLNLIDSALSDNPESQYVDYLILLRAMNHGEIDGVYKYQYELGDFIGKFAESDLKDYAQQLLTTTEEYQIDRFNASRAKFIRNFDDIHYFVLVYPTSQELIKTLPDIVNEFVNSYAETYDVGNLIFDDVQSMILVSEFADKSKATSFVKNFDQNGKIPATIKTEKLHTIVLTKENFDIFFKTKDLDSYLTFYEKYYR